MQTNPQRRLTLANGELTPEEAPPPVEKSSPKKFLSAYEEKKLLQQSMGDTPGGSGSANSAPVPAPAPARPVQNQQQRSGWLSAEEEKRKLNESAKQQAGMGNYSSLPVGVPCRRQLCIY